MAWSRRAVLQASRWMVTRIPWPHSLYVRWQRYSVHMIIEEDVLAELGRFCMQKRLFCIQKTPSEERQGMYAADTYMLFLTL